MENEYVSRHEHEEFIKRISSEHKRLEDENNRQNHRIENLETKIGKILDLATSVSVLAENMRQMLEEQKEQGRRLTALENKDGEKWRKFVGILAGAVIGGIIGYILKAVGLV